jgi:hypothetical protein
MPDGTTIEIFAPRIHKSNAVVVREEAESNISFYTKKLIALACSTPSGGMEGLDERVREVEEAVEELGEAVWRSACAGNIIDFPEDCVDDLEPCKECGQVGFHKMDCGSKGGEGQ